MSKEIKFNGFEEICICHWSKNDEFGFIPETGCAVHGKQAKEVLKNSVEVNMDSLSKETEKKGCGKEIWIKDRIYFICGEDNNFCEKCKGYAISENQE